MPPIRRLLDSSPRLTCGLEDGVVAQEAGLSLSPLGRIGGPVRPAMPQRAKVTEGPKSL